ncbi:PadR family transcriptional regulator [Subtercola boreus]|uniref:PadR family transcriptional regulator n=1 Tax=Subtercola boreus TaxID=120213 RepID=A0A3E0W1C9_9MICO|nr:PadR family transcriptional regulator [Subtercola boreus]RFA16092.1 PadR family transcriptional regulator [Subtercola boreus]
MNPVFGHGHLRLYLLNLLAEQPRHGYELIQALSDRFGGTYSPSAGTIYPRLAKLEEDGLVTKSTDGRKTVYEITDAGRAELDSRLPELSNIEDKVTDSVRMLADGLRAGVNDAMRSLRAELAAAARDTRDGADQSAAAASQSADAVRTLNASTLREVDVLLNSFRAAVRTELRKRAADGALDQAAVATFTSELRRIQSDLKQSVRY